jgi:DNA-directed RNA polymerase subunit K/omega
VLLLAVVMEDATELHEATVAPAPVDAPIEPVEPAPPISSRFLFVDVAALRAKQLRRGARVRFQADQVPMPLKPERVAMEEVRRRLVQYSVPVWHRGAVVVETEA